MTTAFDVPAEPLLQTLSGHLRASGKLHVPEWAQFAKTGAHRERAPRDPNWWYTRCASILRRIYLDGPVGVSRLTTYYGGNRRRGSAAARHARGSGSLIRDALQQMETAGLVKKAKTGRIISPAGRKLLDSLARQIAPPAEKKAPLPESPPAPTPPAAPVAPPAEPPPAVPTAPSPAEAPRPDRDGGRLQHPPGPQEPGEFRRSRNEGSGQAEKRPPGQ